MDPNGSYTSLFYKKGDVTFNPFDARSVSWSIINEVRNPYDIETYSATLIPKSSDAKHENFNSMARTIIKSTMSKVLEMPDISKSAKAQLFLDTLLNSSDDQLRDFLMGTPAFSLLGNTELVGTLRTRIITNLSHATYPQFNW